MNILTLNEVSFSADTMHSEEPHLCPKYLNGLARAQFLKHPVMFLVVDLLKIRGFDRASAAYHFAAFYNRECALNRWQQQPANGQPFVDSDDYDTFFASRWNDPIVHRRPTEDDQRYLTSEVRMFTPSRTELSAMEFSHSGVSAKRQVMADPSLREFRNFIVSANVPEHFFINIAEADIYHTMLNGTIGTQLLYETHESAADELQKGQRTFRIAEAALQVSQLRTNTLTGSGVGSRRSGVYCDSPIPAAGIRII